MAKFIILDYYLFYFLYLSIVQLRSYCSHEWGWIRDTVSIFLKLEFILIELISNHYIQILTNSIRVWHVRNYVLESILLIFYQCSCIQIHFKYIETCVWCEEFMWNTIILTTVQYRVQPLKLFTKSSNNFMCMATLLKNIDLTSHD